MYLSSGFGDIKRRRYRSYVAVLLGSHCKATSVMIKCGVRSETCNSLRIERVSLVQLGLRPSALAAATSASRPCRVMLRAFAASACIRIFASLSLSLGIAAETIEAIASAREIANTFILAILKFDTRMSHP